MTAIEIRRPGPTAPRVAGLLAHNLEELETAALGRISDVGKRKPEACGDAFLVLQAT